MQELAKPLPHNPDAERSVLGAILLDNARLPESAKLLRSSDFFLAHNRIVFSEMLSMHDAGTAIDLVTLTDRLAQNGQLAAAGGAGYIASLIDLVPHISHLEHYAKIVRDTARLRALAHLGQEFTKRALNAAGSDVAEIEEQARASLAQLPPLANGNGNGLPHARTILELLTTEFPKADHLIEGLIPRASSAMLFSKPHRLKSFLTLAITMLATREGRILNALDVLRPVRTLLVSIEDPPGQVKERIRQLTSTRAFADFDQSKCRIITRDQVHGLHLPSKKWHDYLIREAEEIQADLIILDVLRKFQAPGMDINKPSDATDMVRSLEALHDDTGATVTICHHQKKGNDAELMDSSVGSQAFVSWSKVVIRLDNKQEEKTATGPITMVEMETDNAFQSSLEPMRLVLDLAAGEPLRLEGLEEGTGLRKAQDRLAHEWNLRDLSEAEDCSRATAWRRLDQWVKTGKVTKIVDAKPTKGGMARYRFTDTFTYGGDGAGPVPIRHI